MACDSRGGVARNGTLPWPKNKEDLKNFKDYTTGKIVIMGSTTWKDPFMPSPLPNRYNVVLSNNPKSVYEHGEPNIVVSGSPNDILNKFENTSDIVVIGGAKVFDDFVSHGCIDEIQLTIFDNDYNADTFINLTNLMYKFSVSGCIIKEGFKILKLIKN